MIIETIIVVATLVIMFWPMNDYVRDRGWQFIARLMFGGGGPKTW